MAKLNPYKLMKEGRRTIDKKTGDEFNPFNFGKVRRSGNRAQSATERLFSKDGELNASSKMEALEQIKGILQGVDDGNFSVETERTPIGRQANIYEDNMGVDEGDNILREAFADPTSQGFHKVGQALLNPIKEVIDYEGIARKVLAPRTVKAGEVVRYDKDAFVVAHVIAEDAQTPQSVVEGRYVYPPEFEVSSYPSIELRDIYRAQYDVLERIQDKSRMAIEYQEDLAMANLLIAGSTVRNTTTFFANLNLAALEAVRYQIERHRLLCDKFIINRQEGSDFITVLSAQVDPVTQRELIMAGYLGQVLNAMVLTTAGVNTYQILEPGQVLGVASPEYLGGMPIRVELTSEPTNEAHEGRPRRGWFWWELISQVLINADGVALGQRTT